MEDMPAVVRWMLGEETVQKMNPSGMEFLRTGDPPIGSLSHWLDWEFFGYVIFFGVLIILTRIFLTLKVFRPLAVFTGLREDDRSKFVEAAIYVVYYSISWSFIVYGCLRSDFFFNTRLLWSQPWPKIISPDIYRIYVMSTAWYVHCLIAHFTLDTRKSDYWQMLAHHVVTTVLLISSLKVGYFEIGLLVLFSMDVCDVALCGCKIYRYYANIHPSIDKWEMHIFAIVPFSWLGFRIIYYPGWVVYSSLVYSVEQQGWANSHHYFLFNTLLFILLLLNVYWFALIMRITLLVVIAGATPDDVREPSVPEFEDDKDKENDLEDIEDKPLPSSLSSTGSNPTSLTGTATPDAPSVSPSRKKTN